MAPDGWRHVRLMDVADHRRQKVVPTRGDLQPYVALEHLAQGGPRLLGWSTAESAVSAKTAFRAGDLLFGKLRPNLRKAARAPFNGLCSTDILALFGKEGLDSRYLSQMGQWRPLQQHAVATSFGTKMPRTSWADLGELEFSLPPIPEQRKIAAILSSVDEAVEKTQAVIDQVLVVKRGLAQELLTRGIPGRHTHFRQAEIGEIPADWDFCLLGALATPERGLQTGPFGSQLHASDYSPHGVPVLMPKDMVEGRVSDSDSARIPEVKAGELSRHKVKAGDLLFARRGDIGRVGLITEREEGWLCGTGCLRFRPKDQTVSRYLRHWTIWPKSVRWLNEHAVGQTMLNLNTSILGRLPVALPGESERSAIVGALEALDEQVVAVEASVGGLRAVKSALMSVLLTGELRVTPDPEPE